MDNLNCPVCQDILIEPIKLGCGHVITCRWCYGDIGERCPDCDQMTSSYYTDEETEDLKTRITEHLGAKEYKRLKKRRTPNIRSYDDFAPYTGVTAQLLYMYNFPYESDDDDNEPVQQPTHSRFLMATEGLRNRLKEIRKNKSTSL